MPDNPVVTLLLLAEDLLQISQHFLQTFVALLRLHFLHCHLLQVNLVLLQVLEGLQQCRLADLDLQASLLGLGNARFELLVSSLCLGILFVF